jgi:YaaC-like Protein
MATIQHARKVHTSDPSAWAWAALRKFQNVEFVSRRIVQLHQLEPKWAKHSKKQARQVRYCLIQAREYFTAAQTVSLATKPNLLYYGIMSLALAEILFRQSGESSLDMARGENQHHGLIMTAGAIPQDASLAISAGALRATPMEIMGVRRGTFELWHRTSREHPLAGAVTRMLPTGGTTLGFEAVLSAIDAPFRPVPKAGLSLADCLAALPMLVEQMADAGMTPQFVRGTCQMFANVGVQWNSRHIITFHPSASNAVLFAQINAPAEMINRLEFAEVAEGLNIFLHSDFSSGGGNLPLPPAAMVSAEEWRMWTNSPPLNEFGYLYAGLYIAGNYARYYPDRWLTDVEQSTPLATAIEQLCTLTEWRAPWLCLCELDGVLFVNDV